MRRANIGAYLSPTKEALYQPRYDFQVIESLFAFTQFFSVPVGVATSHGVKTFRDTNMTSPNELPHGNMFMVSGIRVMFIPDCALHRGRKAEDEHDAKTVLLGAELRLRISNRDYVSDAPLAKFPSLMPRTWVGELAYLEPEAEEPHWQALYDPPPERLARLLAYPMTPVFIQQHQFFCVDIRAEPAPLNAPGKLGVILDGSIYREAV